MLWILAYVVVGQVVYQALRYIDPDGIETIGEALFLRFAFAILWPAVVCAAVCYFAGDLKPPWWL